MVKINVLKFFHFGSLNFPSEGLLQLFLQSKHDIFGYTADAGRSSGESSLPLA